MKSGACPCGTGLPLDGCCGRFHAGKPAPTAVELMRSRYAAFVLADTAYLLATWDPATRPTEVRIDHDREWEGLEIVDVVAGTLFDQSGEVEFVADHTTRGRRQRLHERSRFRRVSGRWVYTDAVWAEVADG